MTVKTSHSRVTPAYGGDVESFQIDRQLTGSSVPGQARTRAGLVTGGGTITITNTDGTPWKPSILPGDPLRIDTAADLANPLTRIFTGVIDEVEGSALSPSLTLTVNDNIPRRKELNIPQLIGQTCDAAYPIALAIETLQGPLTPAYLGKQLGFDYIGITRRYAGQQVITAGVGGRMPEYVSAGGRLSYALNGAKLVYTADEYQLDPAYAVGITGYDTPTWSIGLSPNSSYSTITIDNYTFEVYVGLAGVRLRKAGFPDRDLIGKIEGAGGELRIRRSTPLFGDSKVFIEWYQSGEWKSATTYTFPNDGLQSTRTLELAGGLCIRWVATEVYHNVYDMKVDKAGVTLSGVITGKYEDAWGFLQQTANECVGAVGFNHLGKLFFSGKDAQRGFDRDPVKTFTRDTLGDLPWKISRDGVADRIVVSYQPLDIVSGGHTTVWEADRVLQVNGGATTVIKAPLEGVGVAQIRGFVQSTEASVEATNSRWIAFTTREGTSTMPAENALSITSRLIGTSTVELRITNNTTSTLWIRDVNGGCGLWIRAGYVARAGEPEYVELGAPDATAQNVFEFNCGATVQNFFEAQEIAAWFQGTLAQPALVVNSIPVDPDPTIRINDVIKIVDRESTGINTRALVTGINYSESAGGPTQSIDIAVLDPLVSQLTDIGLGVTMADYVIQVNSAAEMNFGTTPTNLKEFVAILVRFVNDRDLITVLPV